MDFSVVTQLLEDNLKTHINRLDAGDELFLEILNYGVLPAGKLFRPLICCSTYADQQGYDALLDELKDPYSALSLCASALEIHHAYTLIHDDLPCMDDDDMRRGRPSTHKAYGQWQAVLAGDALLHHSHALLNLIDIEQDKKLRRFFSWALGAKGLIFGQVLDLSGAIHQNFENLKRTHILKTGRLIQTSLYAGAWCARPTIGLRDTLEYMKLGHALGLSFQLLDDLSEGTEALGDHEKSVNPFINFPEQSLKELSHTLSIIKNFLDRPGHEILSKTLENYFMKMRSIIEKDLSSKESLIFSHFDVIEESDKEGYHKIVELLLTE